ncbi:acyl-CoA carboxylase subunit epsilon [uncultured Corynebacterium sp.]|uniref:acyl-CoA carboxylase subunit epsilon n=1 Tax=uncultured Corynebacterium sp. TaxID=159447 RepID=UPI0025CD87E6|nr:acyl-CoA carboxylase subunit epsilon [uncultured Corynebacterium sp.]
MTDNANDTTATDSAADAGENAEATKAPFLKVVKGNPTDAQVAALAVLFAGMANGAADAGPKGPRNQWGNLEDRLQQPLSHSPGSFQNVQFF